MNRKTAASVALVRKLMDVSPVEKYQRDRQEGTDRSGSFPRY
jgi:hypothetical protein